VEELNGQDPLAYIISSNVHRRHMTKGQRAMAVAMIYPEKGRGKTPRNLEFSAERVRQARAVLHWSPELSDGVLSGAESLDRAYAIASSRKIDAEAPALRLEALRGKGSAPQLRKRFPRLV
jgi:hypothetical protein